MILVPEAFAPQFAAPTVEVRHTCGQEEQTYKETFLSGRSLAEPGRNDGNEQVKAEKRIHEPQMPRQRREIKEYARQVGNGTLQRKLPPKQRKSAVKNHENEERRQYAQGTLAVEVPRTLPFLHRREQKRRNNHEQRNRHTRETVIHRHPQTVGLRSKICLRTHHVGSPFSSIIVFTRMHKHYQEARKYTDIIQ